MSDLFELPVADAHYSVEDIREIEDGDDLQDIIRQYDVIITHIKNQLEYRSNAPRGWEQQATAALTANQILRRTANERLHKVSGRAASNQQANELMQQQAKSTKAQKAANSLERQRLEAEGRKVKAVKQVVHLASQLSYDRCFRASTRRVLSQHLDLLSEIEAEAQRMQDAALQRELKHAGLDKISEDAA